VISERKADINRTWQPQQSSFKIIMMKRKISVIALLFFVWTGTINSQVSNDTVVYLLTCGPGTETYSIYGHSAIRVVIPGKNSDIVYNWGIFDFSTPHFVWKFAKGRLDYMLGTETVNQFLQIYFIEKRFVVSQRINLDPNEIRTLLALINENLRPENVRYRYDFFLDNCSTRIRDLLEKSVGVNLLYPPDDGSKDPTFRDMISRYQNKYPWLKFGVDLLVGPSADRRASFRNRMFLPLDMQKEMSEVLIRRESKMIPLLQNPEVILDFKSPVIRSGFMTSPLTVFSLVLILLIIISALPKSGKVDRIIDIAVFSLFSVLAVLMLFFNFFTDHIHLRWNLNILWLNPFIIICLAALILNKNAIKWFRALFYISVAFIASYLILPQEFNISVFPLLLILLLRSSVRSRFSWNPFVLPGLQEQNDHNLD
jgi:hypothetical protein